MTYYSVDPGGIVDLSEEWTLLDLQAEAAQLHLPLIEFEEGKFRLGGRVFASSEVVDMACDAMADYVVVDQVEHWVEDYLGQDDADCDRWESRNDY